MMRSKRFAEMSRHGIAIAFAFLLMAAIPARSTISTDYLFEYGTGSETDMTSGFTQINFTSNDDGSQTAAPYNIGFDFVFNGVTYTQFSVNSNGLMKLGGAPVVSGTRFNEDFPNFGPPANDMPFLAPLWDDLYIKGTGTRFKVTGTAPRRVLTVQWHMEKYSLNNLEDMRIEVRLHETSNKIEFYYSELVTQPGANVFNALIAIAASTSDYARVVPGTPPQVFYSGSGTVTPPAANTLYSFRPCMGNIDVIGDVLEGGTSTMADGDSLFTDVQVQRGSSASYIPFHIFACVGRDYDIAISGPAAADYQITPTSGTLGVDSSQPIAIDFTPLGVGIRHATIVVTDDNGFSRSYPLAAEGLSRISYTGNIPQGGTAVMNDGDTLMQNIVVRRLSQGSFTPFTITNTNPDGSAPPASINYTLRGTSGGQFTITPSAVSIDGNETSTPVITFRPNFTRGWVIDTLIVNADGEVRQFVLRSYSASPEAHFRVDAILVDSTSATYTNQNSCVGEQNVSHVVNIANPGNEDVTLSSFEVYETDTIPGPGFPPYPLRRDAQGRVVPSRDYIVTLAPPVMPLGANTPIEDPIVIPAGTNLNVYLTFVGQYPGRRFARLFVRTDAVNTSGADTNGMMTPGIFTTNFYGRGVGSRLASNAAGTLSNSLSFPVTHLGDSTVMLMTIYNPGVCTLRVWLPMLTIVQGDADEFSIVQMPNNLIDPVTNDLLVPPGMSDTVVISFKPQQIGSRRAGIRLRTNDSTLGIPGITERGFQYVDLFGIGRADLYANDVEFGQALIGGGPAEYRHGKVTMKNTKTTAMRITAIILEGPDASEFGQDPAGSWPTLPTILNPGKEVDLGVYFGPAAGGSIGDRNAVLKLVTSDGDTIVARLHGIAGTRTIGVSPQGLNLNVSVGKISRRSITITNNGTMPVRLEQPVLSPGSDFTIGTLPRLDLVPGQTEYLEVTYMPTVSGSSNAVITIMGNPSNAPLQVGLSGTGLKTKLADADPSATAVNGNGSWSDPLNPLRHGGDDQMSLSGVEEAAAAAGMQLSMSVPNPGRDVVEIRYTLGAAAEVELGLYDGQGQLVKVLDGGYRTSGERVLRVDVRDLPAGIYHYRLSNGHHMISRRLAVVK